MSRSSQMLLYILKVAMECLGDPNLHSKELSVMSDSGSILVFGHLCCT